MKPLFSEKARIMLCLQLGLQQFCNFCGVSLPFFNGMVKHISSKKENNCHGIIFICCLLLFSHLFKCKTGKDDFSLPVLAYFFQTLKHITYDVSLCILCIEPWLTIQLGCNSVVTYSIYIYIKILPFQRQTIRAQKISESFPTCYESQQAKENIKAFCQSIMIQSTFDKTFTELLFEILISQNGICLPKYISIITGKRGPQRKTSTSREKACNFDSSCVNCSLEVLISFHTFRDKSGELNRHPVYD